MNDIGYCPFCGEETESSSNQCKHCWSLLTGDPTDVSPAGIDFVRQVVGDRYEVVEEIGRGGMATVYKALQKNLNRPVALKVIHNNLLHDKILLERFHREAQLAASLQHPNIVKIFDLGGGNGIHFIAMEFLEGIDLREFIRSKNRLRKEQCFYYLTYVARALQYAHSRGILHRDIKSSNIFITETHRVVLLDFGIAYAAEGTRLTKTGHIIGSPAGMSPEQAEGKNVDHRTDIYSLGVVAYECLSGVLPSYADNPVTQVYKIINERPDPEAMQFVPTDIRDYVMNLLSKHPGDRPENASEVLEGFKLLMQSFTIKFPEQFIPDQTAKHEISQEMEQIALDKNIDQNSYEAWSDLAKKLSNLNMNNHAIAAYEKALLINPKFLDAWVKKANLALEEIRPFESAESYDRALDLEPENSEIWYSKAEAFERHFQREEVLEAYKRVIEINPKNTEAWVKIIEILWYFDRNNEALEACNRAIRINPNEARLWQINGETLRILGRHHEAIEAFERAIEKNPKSVKAWDAMARELSDLYKGEEALKAIEKALEFESQAGNRWIWKAELLIKLSKYDKALEAYDRALECETNYTKEHINLRKEQLDKLLNPNKQVIDQRNGIKLREIPNIVDKYNFIHQYTRLSESDNSLQSLLKEDQLAYYDDEDIFYGSLNNLSRYFKQHCIVKKLNNGEVGIFVIFFDYNNVFCYFEESEFNLISMLHVGNPYILQHIFSSLPFLLSERTLIMPLYALALFSLDVHPTKGFIISHQKEEQTTIVTATTGDGVLEMKNIHHVSSDNCSDAYYNKIVQSDFSEEEIVDYSFIELLTGNKSVSSENQPVIDLFDLFENIKLYEGIKAGLVANLLLLPSLMCDLFIRIDGKKVYKINKSVTIPTKKHEWIELGEYTEVEIQLVSRYVNEEIVIYTCRWHVPYLSKLANRGLTEFDFDIDENRMLIFSINNQLHFQGII